MSTECIHEFREKMEWHEIHNVYTSELVYEQLCLF